MLLFDTLLMLIWRMPPGLCWSRCHIAPATWIPLHTTYRPFPWVGGPAQIFFLHFFSSGRPNFSKLSEEQKYRHRQTVNNTRLFFWQLDNRPPRCSPFWWRSPAALGDQIKNWRSSPHVESISTCGDNRLFLFFLQRSPRFENNTFLLVFLSISSRYQ